MDFASVINDAAKAWWPYVLHATWTSSLVAALALAAVRIGRRWPAQIRLAILLVALIKFAIPPLLSLPTGLFSIFGPRVAIEANQPAAAGQHETASPRKGAVDWQGWLFIVHLAGAAVAAGWIAVQAGSVLRLSRRAREIRSGRLYESLMRLHRRMALRRRVRLLITRDDITPMAFGVLRPSVILPVGLCRQLSASHLEAVVAHELAHHRRGDLWLNWIQIGLGVVWWFNPVYRLLAWELRRTSEDRCDDLLVGRGLTGGGGYCQALLHVAGRLGRRVVLGGALGFADRLHPLAERMKRIMDPTLCRQTKSPWRLAAGAMLLALMVLPGLSSQKMDFPVAAPAGPRTPLALSRPQAVEQIAPVELPLARESEKPVPASTRDGRPSPRRLPAFTEPLGYDLPSFGGPVGWDSPAGGRGFDTGPCVGLGGSSVGPLTSPGLAGVAVSRPPEQAQFHAASPALAPASAGGRKAKSASTPAVSPGALGVFPAARDASPDDPAGECHRPDVEPPSLKDIPCFPEILAPESKADQRVRNVLSVPMTMSEPGQFLHVGVCLDSGFGEMTNSSNYPALLPIYPEWIYSPPVAIPSSMPIPEPATMFLLTAGGMLLLRHRKF